VIGKTSTTANGQNKTLTELITSLLSAIEEQKQEQMEAMEEQKRAHANQIETLSELFTKQIESLKAEVAELIQTQWSNIQNSSAVNLSYSEIWLYGNRRFRAWVPIYREFPYSQMHVIAKSDF
jgi:restriction endonuclease S subunit